MEPCNIDVIMQAFKRSIIPRTPFFESISKKPPKTIDNFFWRGNKYAMLEDDLRAASQQIVGTS